MFLCFAVVEIVFVTDLFPMKLERNSGVNWIYIIFTSGGC